METTKISTNLPTELWEKLKELAKENRRTYTAELIIAIEKHVAQEEAKKDGPGGVTSTSQALDPG